MKKSIFLLSLILSWALTAQTPQISNGSFENWTPHLIKSLHDYMDAADEGNTDNIQQMTDAVSGQYSVKIETTQGDNDLNLGYFINFDPDHDFAGGVPYTSHIDSICGYYKAHLVAQDTALLVALFKNNGTPVGGNIYTFAADKNTNNWTRFCYPTQMPIGVVPDSLMLGAASSNAINEIGMEAGSWIQFDSIFFKNGNQPATPPPNHSFENWDLRTVDYPDHFDTTLKWDNNTNPLSIKKSTDATNGNYSVKITTVVNQFQDTIIGTITNATIGDWPYSGGLQIGETPNEVSWDYKVQYAGHFNFDPNVWLIFKQNGQEIASYGHEYNQSVNTFQHEDIIINTTTTPDSLYLVASSGGYPGNSLWLDNVVLYYPSGKIGSINIQRAVAYPIPAENMLNFKIEALKPEHINLSIIDMNGRLIKQTAFSLKEGKNSIRIPLNDLTPGNYLYKISNKEGQITHLFIKN